LSRERAEPPDIDLDIEHARREEVIQHVYTVYGRDHAAMVCNVIRYRPRSAVRDVGKVLGVPETALDRAAKQLARMHTVEPDALDRAGLGAHGPGVLAHLVRLSREILEFPRHLSIHPGGFLLGHEPVHDIVPIENGAMADRTVIQLDKDDLEELGLFKVDLLALGALHQLHLAFDLLRASRGLDLRTVADVPKEDPATYDMICTADTIGTFQIESRAQMSMLPRLKPRMFYDLVVEVSLVRPGPISGGMVHPYLRRRDGLEKVEYPHACLEPVLEKTLGVPLFQEQVMKLAIVAADYTPGEADQLRRDMAAWRRSGRIEQHRERLIGRMTAKGIPSEFAERVFDQIRGFGEYGFPESHAASFAMIAYATSWLRKHYPPEFLCSLLNAQPMGFYSPATLVGDAQRHGVEVRSIDVMHSRWDATLEPIDGFDFAVRMGLRWVRGLAASDGERILAARAERPFLSIEDFVRRTGVADRGHTALAEAGAFASLDAHSNRRDALWQVHGWIARQADALEVDASDDDGVGFAPLTQLDEILWDYKTSVHSTRGHPLAPLRDELRAQHLPDARTVQTSRDGARIDYVGVVICRQQPQTAKDTVFFTLEDETGFVNLVVWSHVFAAYATVFRTQSLLGVTGQLQVQEGVVHLIAERAWTPRLSRPVIEIESRDFH
jgi:error-prone DNA polymerase